MTTVDGRRRPFGTTFTLALLLSWTMVSAAVLALAWADRHTSTIRLATWGSLWMFSVLMPTLNAFTIHRALHDFSIDRADGTGRELERLRGGLLLSATLAVLSAVALILGR